MADFVNNKQEQEDIIINPTESICFTYDFKTWHLIIPPVDTIFYLCKSYDKTYMFLAALARTIIVLIVTKLYYDYIDTKNYVNNTGLQVLYALATINIIILLYISIKQVHEPKIYLDEIPPQNLDKLLPGDRLIQTH